MMMIPEVILQKYHARINRVQKGQLLFSEGDQANDFTQVMEGRIKMFTVNVEGQEFTQGFFEAGESFGEPALLGNFQYPSSAMAIVDSKVWRLPKDQFLQLLRDNFELHLQLDQVLCLRLQYKAMVLAEISSHAPEHRLTTIMTYLKSKMKRPASGKTIMPFTRQQLADMTGLRVETVIRTIKKMSEKGTLILDGRKIKF